MRASYSFSPFFVRACAQVSVRARACLRAPACVGVCPRDCVRVRMCVCAVDWASTRVCSWIGALILPCLRVRCLQDLKIEAVKVNKFNHIGHVLVLLVKY